MAIFYHQVVFWVSRSGAEWLSIMFVRGDFIEEHWGRIGCRAQTHTHTHTQLMCVWRGGVYDGWCWGWRWSDHIEFAGIWVSMWLTSRALARTLQTVFKKKWKQLKCRCYIQVHVGHVRLFRSCSRPQEQHILIFFQQCSRGMKKHSQDCLPANIDIISSAAVSSVRIHSGNTTSWFNI